jgi:AcrR family transcriptional regulator
VPKNRRPRDRDDKHDEILAAALELFTSRGYDTTSMAQVAAATGVTTTTIYWYFTDKDALLLAVLDHVLENVLSELPSQLERPLDEQLLWALARLRSHRRLVVTVHARTARVPAIATWHDGFHELMNAVLADGLRRQGVLGEDIPALTTAGVFVIEGLLTHETSESHARSVLRVLTDKVS